MHYVPTPPIYRLIFELFEFLRRDYGAKQEVA